MKTKFFTLLSLSVLALVMMVSLVSAVSLNPITVYSIPSSVSQDDGSFTFTFDLTNAGIAGNLNYSASIVTNTGATITFDDSYIADDSVTSVTETITATVAFPFGSTSPISGTVDVLGDLMGSSETLPFSVTMTPSTKPEDVQTCLLTADTAGEDNDELELSIEDVTITGFGEEDYEWFPFDEIEVELEIENDHNEYKIEDITIGWGLYDLDAEEWYVNEEENDFNLKDGDTKTMFLTFTLDDDMDELVEGDYVFYVWANAKLDDGADKELCASVSEEVTIMDESDFVIVNNIQMTPETTACGTSVQLTADVWNIGTGEQEGVYVIIDSEESLGLTQRIDIGEIDAYEDEEISVLLNIPQDAEEKIYSFFLTVFDEYGDAFENSNDDKAKFQVDLKVEGNCINEPKVDISADLESEARAGRELIVKVTIENTGTETSTFEIDLSDYIEWATLGSISSEGVVTLDAGESEDVLVTLNVNSDISGSQNFGIVVTEGTKVKSYQVPIMIEKSGFAGITGGLISEGNWPIWTIGAINVVLVFVIILVALKVAKKQ